MRLSWFVIVLGLSTAHSTSPSARELYEYGQRHSANKEWGEALAEFRAATRLDPNFMEAFYAISLAEMRVHGDGVSHCEEMYEPLMRVLELDPKGIRAADAHTSLGLLFTDVRNDPDSAEKHFREAIRLNDKVPEAHRVVMAHAHLAALLHEERDDRVGAEVHYREVIRLSPRTAGAEVRYNLGVILDGREDYSSAEFVFGEAIRHIPDLPQERGRELLKLAQDAMKIVKDKRAHIQRAFQVNGAPRELVSRAPVPRFARRSIIHTRAANSPPLPPPRCPGS